MHVGIIPDGNRRWCNENDLRIDTMVDRLFAQIETFVETVLHTPNPMEITELSVYALSLDNLSKRNDGTLDMVQDVLDRMTFVWRNAPHMGKAFAVQFVGDVDRLPESFRTSIDQIHASMELDAPGLITVALAYDPIRDLDGQYVRLREQSPIDLVVRSGGEFRSSGFFPRHTLYSEWVFLDEYFPDAIAQDVIERVLETYRRRIRRFGA